MPRIDHAQTLSPLPPISDENQTADFSLWSPRKSAGRAHLIGICGAGMKALSEFLIDRGWQISGCDGDPDPHVLQEFLDRGITIHVGHSIKHLAPPPDVVVYSAAVPDLNVERCWATELGIPRFSYVAALAQLTAHSQAVAIAGTHGKSTTTAMLAMLLRSAGRSDSVICGAEISGIERSGWGGTSSRLVLEACEFRRHFTGLHPQIACLLGIEPDHFDCYPTLAEAEAAYREFALRVPSEGILIARSDCPATLRVLAGVEAEQITFSLSDPTANWQARNCRSVGGGMRFELVHDGIASEEIQLQMPGVHNVQNALAAAACASVCGLSLAEIVAGLTSFPGLKRRFEHRGTWRGSPVIDDYAHHPSEIRATLMAARAVFPDQRLICLFQPHQISRTAALLSEFAAALSLADRLYLLPIYAARESQSEQQIQLVRELHSRVRIPASLISTLDQVWGTVQTDAGNDAVILTLGAGNLSRIHHDHID